MLADGTEVEFDREGAWVEVKRRGYPVPADIVPAEIVDYVNKYQHGAMILGIERDRQSYEVKLGNGFEVKFDKQFRVIDIDD